MPTKRARNRGPNVPITVLLGRHLAGAERAVRRLAATLARQLRHDVETCDLAQPRDPVARVEAGAALRIHRGRAPADDDVARMLGDRARDGVRTLAGGRRPPAQVSVVIATGGGANP